MKLFVVLLTVWLAAPHGARAYDPVEVHSGGSIVGTVRLTTAPPTPEPQRVSKDHGTCGAQVPDERYVVGPAGQLANAVVFIDGITAGKAIGKPTAEIDNVKCRFVPHVAAFPVGTQLWIKNSDGVLHNVHAYLGKDKTVFNMALPTRGIKIPKKIRDPGIMEFRCDAGHVWMRGWAVVTEHPYVAVSDADGLYSLTDVPPGRYEVQAWHEHAGTRELGRVTVEAGKAATVDVSF